MALKTNPTSPSASDRVRSHEPMGPPACDQSDNGHNDPNNPMVVPLNIDSDDHSNNGHRTPSESGSERGESLVRRQHLTESVVVSSNAYMLEEKIETIFSLNSMQQSVRQTALQRYTEEHTNELVHEFMEPGMVPDMENYNQIFLMTLRKLVSVYIHNTRESKNLYMYMNEVYSALPMRGLEEHLEYYERAGTDATEYQPKEGDPFNGAFDEADDYELL